MRVYTKQQRKILSRNNRRHVATCTCKNFIAIGTRYEVNEDSELHDDAPETKHIVKIVRKRFGH